MGCFNVAGTMSNISIGHSEEVVFFILKPSSGYRREAGSTPGTVVLHPQSSMCSNDGSKIYYKPLFLPVFGEYNDYGSVENIKEDANTKHIEEYFGLPIDDIIGAICSYDNEGECETEELTTELRSCSGMFELREVYENMSNFMFNENIAYKNLWLSEDVLIDLGFVHDKDISTNDTRYSKHYAHPGVPEIYVHCDGQFSRVMCTDKTNDELHSIYRLESLCEEYKTKFGKDITQVIDVDKYKSNCTHNFSVIDAILKQKEIAAIEDELERMTAEFRARDSGGFQMTAELAYALSAVHQQAYVDYLNFNDAMFSSNNIYMPANNGEQHGNDDVSLALYKVSATIMDERLKERDW